MSQFELRHYQAVDITIANDLPVLKRGFMVRLLLAEGGNVNKKRTKCQMLLTRKEYVPYFGMILNSRNHGRRQVALACQAMAKTAEDNFRIEVWDREEQALSETISRSPDATVSQAAWQAAIRRRPGMLLIHYNSRHVMEKILTPGEVKIAPQTIVDGSVHAGLDVALGDLREWHVLRAWCRSCSHHAPVKPAGLIKRYGKGALFSSVERALFCTSCDRGGLSGWKFTSCHAIEGS